MGHFMIKWVTVGILSLQASLSLAAELPNPVTRSDFPDAPFSTVLLGRDLFYDPILSGNQNIACASCHLGTLNTTDDAAIGIGMGGPALEQPRFDSDGSTSLDHLIRKTPALYNLGAAEFTTLFKDGRVMKNPDERMGFTMPNGAALERPASSVLAAQAMLLMAGAVEMAGAPGENAIADLVDQGKLRGMNGAWQKLTERVEAVPEYRRRFKAVIGPYEPLHINDISNALAAFIAYEFRSTDSPFDEYLSGRDRALTPAQKRGMTLFYGTAGCAACHSGPFQTDHKFHAIAMPQLGAGIGTPEPFSDIGRAAVTGNKDDAYKFRTPSLRNIAHTAPYGHSGAYATLEAVVRHHLDPVKSLYSYDPTQVTLPGLTETALFPSPVPGSDELKRIADANELAPIQLTPKELDDLLSFLNALSDPQSVVGRLGAPARVPSGLPVAGIRHP